MTRKLNGDTSTWLENAALFSPLRSSFTYKCKMHYWYSAQPLDLWELVNRFNDVMILEFTVEIVLCIKKRSSIFLSSVINMPVSKWGSEEVEATKGFRQRGNRSNSLTHNFFCKLSTIQQTVLQRLEPRYSMCRSRATCASLSFNW